MAIQDTGQLVERLDAPTDRPVEHIDVREMGPPAPLKETLEMLADLDEETLDSRGYEYATGETDEGVLTAIWRP
jgi:hypothetical protein